MQLEVLLGTAVATPGDICDPFLLVHQCRGEVPFDLQLTVQLEVLLGIAVATPGDICERSRRSLSLFSIHVRFGFFQTKPWRLRHRRGADSGRRPSCRRPSGRATSGGNSGRTPVVVVMSWQDPTVRHGQEYAPSEN